MHISSLPLPNHILSPAATGLLPALGLTLMTTVTGPIHVVWIAAAFLALQTVLTFALHFTQ